MTVDADLALLSDRLLLAAVVGYALALIAYAADVATRRSRGAPHEQPVADRVLVGAGAPVPAEPGRVEPAQVESGGNPRAARTGDALFAVATVLLLACLATRGWAEERVPFGNMYEFAVASALAGAAAYLVLLVRQQARWLGLLVTLSVVLTLGLAGTVLYTSAGPLVPALDSYWLQIHVTAAIVSAGALAVGSIAAGLFLVRLRYDARRAAGKDVGLAGFGRRLPHPDVLDRTAQRVITFAFPIWTFAIIAGAIWAEAAWGRYWGWDPKETWAFITWVVYAGYLHARSTAGWRGKRSAWIALVGFAAFLFNFFGVNIAITGLHSYAGI